MNDPTTGRDSVYKAVRRNLSPRRFGVLLRLGADAWRRGGAQSLGREITFRWRLATHGDVWRHRADIPLKRELKAQRGYSFAHKPLISVVVPLYNTPERYLREMVRSVKGQSYGNWQLVLVDASGEPLAAATALAVKDSRIKLVRAEKNEGIAGNTNIGLEAAQGEYIALLDHDDVLQPNALFELALAIEQTGADFLYSDEIVLTGDLKHLGEYHFKPDFGPDTLRGCNYITHLCAFSKELLSDGGGGENSEYDGAQDFDLILRLTERAQRIRHIPKVLYFWRRHEQSTAGGIEQKPYALKAGARAIEAQLARLGLPGSAEPQKGHAGSYRVRYEIQGEPLVSVLIPNKDHTEDLERCLTSLYEKAGWPHFEVLVIENNSELPETERYYKAAQKKYKGLRVLRYEGGFNFAAICNLGARQASGQHLLLLNNDTEILSDNFLPELLGYSQRPDVGAVGAMLYYPDDTVQHAGLFVGIGGTAGVNHKGHARGDGGDLFRLCTAQNMSAVTGACLMVKAALYNAMDGMDEVRFGVAFNDVDLCLRLREQGLWNVFTPYAEAYHYESKSRGYDTEGPNAERFAREVAVFRERHAEILRQGDPFYNPHFTLEHENYGYK